MTKLIPLATLWKPIEELKAIKTPCKLLVLDTEEHCIMIMFNPDRVNELLAGNWHSFAYWNSISPESTINRLDQNELKEYIRRELNIKQKDIRDLAQDILKDIFRQVINDKECIDLMIDRTLESELKNTVKNIVNSRTFRGDITPVIKEYVKTELESYKC